MRAVVVGAGIGGSVAALALQRAGVEVAVHESRAAGPGDEGSFLTLGGNGIAALRHVGVAGAVARAGVPTTVLSLRDHRGRRLGTMPNGEPALDGSESTTVRRHDLHRALHDALDERAIPVRYGRRLVTVDERPDHVVARFDDGTEAPADLLVGADGVHSTTRTLIDPAAPRPRYVPLLNTGGYARGVDVTAEPGTFEMVFGLRAFLGYLQGPDGVWWFANVPHREEPARGALAAITDAQWRTRLVDLFRGDTAPGADLVHATPHPLTGWATYDLPRVPTWRTARTVLVGDAAHAVAPSSGQGAAMAIEDGVELARCVRDVDGVPRALEAYEHLRRARVERVVAWGARSSSTKVAGPVGRVVRDLATPLVLPLLARSRQEWLFRYPLEWDARVTEPTVA